MVKAVVNSCDIRVVGDIGNICVPSLKYVDHLNNFWNTNGLDHGKESRHKAQEKFELHFCDIEGVFGKDLRLCKLNESANVSFAWRFVWGSRSTFIDCAIYADDSEHIPRVWAAHSAEIHNIPGASLRRKTRHRNTKTYLGRVLDITKLDGSSSIVDVLASHHILSRSRPSP